MGCESATTCSKYNRKLKIEHQTETTFKYKNGRVTETVFEKFEILEKIISNRVKCGLVEEKISKSRVRSLLSQALNVAGDIVGDEAIGVRNILSEGIKVVDELGILLFQPYCLRRAFKNLFHSTN